MTESVGAAPGPEIPAQPDRLVLRTTKRKAVFLLVSAMVLVIAGLLMATSGGIAMIIGWFVVVFFFLAGAVSVFMLASNKSYLLITRDGFQISGFATSRFIPWSDVANFGATSTLVFFRFRPGAKPIESYPAWARGLRLMNRGLTGGWDAGLPDTYGLKPLELAALMDSWRSRFAPAKDS